MRTPAGDVVLDESGRLAGRGAYVCRGTDCLTIAIDKGALTRALETPLPPTFLAHAATVGARAIPMHDTEGGARGQE